MKLFTRKSLFAASLAVSSKCVSAIELDLTDPSSIKNVAATIAYDMMTYYTGNISGSQNGAGYPGILQLPFPPDGGYYWWEAGGMWGAMIDYWYYTGDTSYNDVVSQAIVFQSNAPANDFMPANQSTDMGNDDQGFWGMTAMTAAEVNFPPPPADSKIPGWLALAQGVFNTQATRWANSTCGGGLPWQVFQDEAGFTYKNSISNGVFFNIGSRLALYTGNNTYYNWANTTYTWMARIGLLNEASWAVFDGSSDVAPLNCSQLDHDQWTYNVGIYLFGVANMYNFTSSLDPSDVRSLDAPVWKERLTGLATSGIDMFLENGILFEACEAPNTCNSDRKSFKAYLARWMAATTKIAPFTYDILQPRMVASATAAALQCSGGVNNIGTGAGRQCGLRWTMNGTYDGDTGVGQQMAALEIIQGNLITQAADTFTNSTGGISVGDPAAGSSGGSIGPNGLAPIIVTESDRVGAGFITFFTLVFIISACWWMVSGERISSTAGQNASIASDRKREWGWGDLSMSTRLGGRRQFTQKGYADRDSMALEKLGAGAAGSSGMMESERGSAMMTPAPGSERGSETMMYASGALGNESNMDVYEGRSILPFSPVGAGGSRPGSRGVGGAGGLPYSPTSPTAMLAHGAGSRPGSRGVGAAV